MDQRASAHLSGHLIKSFEFHKEMAAQQQAQAQAQARAAFTPRYIMQPADTQAMSYSAPPSQHFGQQHGGYAPSQFMELSEQSGRMIATMQKRLSQKLGPEYVTQRPGPGGGPKLSYIEGWKVINLANEIFGFNGWSSQIVALTVDFCDPHGEPTSNRWNIGVSAIIRVTLRDGVYHEDVGYGQADNAKGKGAALDKAKKEAVTDGVKRSLRSFGNVLGNCLYDKDYGKAITQMKVEPVKFNPQTLYRRPEYDPEFQASSVASSSKPHPMESNDYNCPPRAPPAKLYQHQPPHHPAPPSHTTPIASSSRLPPNPAPAHNSHAAREHHAHSLAHGQSLNRSETTALWAGMPDLGDVAMGDVSKGYDEKDSGVEMDVSFEGDGDYDGFIDAAFNEEELLMVESQAARESQTAEQRKAIERSSMPPPPIPSKALPSHQRAGDAGMTRLQHQNNTNQEQTPQGADRSFGRRDVKADDASPRARNVGGFNYPTGQQPRTGPTLRSENQQQSHINRNSNGADSSGSNPNKSTAASLRAESIRACLGEGSVHERGFGESRSVGGVHEMDRIAAKAIANPKAKQFGMEFEVEHGSGADGEMPVGFMSARGMKRSSPGDHSDSGGAASYGSPSTGNEFGRSSTESFGGVGRRALAELNPTDLPEAKRLRA